MKNLERKIDGPWCKLEGGSLNSPSQFGSREILNFPLKAKKTMKIVFKFRLIFLLLCKMNYRKNSSQDRKLLKFSTRGISYVTNIYLIIFQPIIHNHRFLYRRKG